MIVGLSGKKQSGKNLIAKIWQLLDLYHQTKDTHKCKETDVQFVKFYLESPKSNPAPNHGSNWKQKSFASKLKQIVCLLIGCTMEQLEDPIFKETELGEEWLLYRHLKSNEIITEKLYKSLEFLDNQKYYTPEYLTPRKLLQLIGTNCFRDLIHPEIWVNALFSEYTGIKYKFFNGNYSCKCKYCKKDFTGAKLQPLCLDCCNLEIQYPNWLITDVRFKNEAKSILDRKGLLIRVNRFCYDSAEDFCVCNPDKEISKQGIHIVSNFSGDEFVQRINKLALDNGYISLKEQHTSETDLDEYDKFNYIIDNTGSIENLIEEVKEIMIKEGFINRE